jgi:excisionase family DNA binding protein
MSEQATESAGATRQRPRKGTPLPTEKLGLVTMQAVAEQLGLPLKWFRRACKAGRMPCVQVGQRLLFDPEQVQKHIHDAAAQNQFGQWVR